MSALPVSKGRRGTVRGGLIMFLARLLVLAAAVAGWQLGTTAANNPYYLPPFQIASGMYHRWFDGPVSHLWLTADATANLLPSLGRMLGGWAIAAAVGIALGVAIGRLPVLADLAEPLVHFGRAVPPPTLVPVFLVAFKIGTQMEVATIVFGVIWPVLLNSIDGARNVDAGYIETARAFRLSPAQRLMRVYLPGAAPKICAGLRLSLALALVMMILSEFVGSSNGIGYEMLSASTNFDIPQMWQVIGLLGVLGIVLSTLFTLAEHRILAWQRVPQEATA
jgi:ABC-type nitrate/sulfonate/bicarbonate transport system permease component